MYQNIIKKQFISVEKYIIEKLYCKNSLINFKEIVGNYFEINVKKHVNNYSKVFLNNSVN
jgi:hypothetical protein